MPRLRLAFNRLNATRRGFISIVGATAAGQVVALVAAPALTRLFTPTDFGLYAVLAALVTVAGTVFAFRLEAAIALPEKESAAYGLVAGGFLACVAGALVGTAGVAVAGDRLASMLGQADLMPWLWLVPLASALMSSYLILNQLAIRQRRYQAVARRNVVHATTMVVTQVAAGVLGIKSAGLFLGLLLAHGVGAASLTRGSGLTTVAAREGIRPSQVRRVLRRYRRHVILLTPSGLLNVMGLQAPVILFAYHYGSQVAGWLGLTQRVLALPVALIGTAVAQVFLAEFAAVAKTDLHRALRLFTRASRALVLASSVLLVLVLFAAPAAFSLIFGEAWAPSGQYARALAVGLAAQMIGSPLSQTLIVLERPGMQLACDALRLAAVSAAVYGAAWSEASAASAVWILGGASAAVYALSWWLSYRCLVRATAAAGRRRR